MRVLIRNEYFKWYSFSLSHLFHCILEYKKTKKNQNFDQRAVEEGNCYVRSCKERSLV